MLEQNASPLLMSELYFTETTAEGQGEADVSLLTEWGAEKIMR